MNKNTNSNTALTESKSSRKKSLTIFGGAALITASIVAAPFIAHSVSAANLSNGVMMVRTVDKEGFEGFAGRAGDGSNPGTENPGGGDNGGTDPGTGNPTNPGNGGTDPGTGNPTDPGNGGTNPEAPIVRAAVTITSCKVDSTLGTFKQMTLTWTSPQAPNEMLLEVGRYGDRVPADKIGSSKVGELFTYTSVIDHKALIEISGGLSGAENTVRVVAGSSKPVGFPPVPNQASAYRTLSVGGLLGLGGDNTCK